MPSIPKYMEPMAEVIRINNVRIREHRNNFGGISREWRTRYWLIDPILRALGWDVNNPDEVSVEYLINGKLADYAFFVPGQKNPVMIVEAKSIDDNSIAYVLGEIEDTSEDTGADWIEWSEDHISQLSGYAAELNQGYAVLTDGIAWCIWDLSEGKDLAQGTWYTHLWTLLDEDSQVYFDVCDALKILHRRNILRKFG